MDVKIPLKFEDLGEDSDSCGFGIETTDYGLNHTHEDLVAKFEDWSDADLSEDPKLTSGEVNNAIYWALKELGSLSDHLRLTVGTFLRGAVASCLESLVELNAARKHNCKKIMYYFLVYCTRIEAGGSADAGAIVVKAKGRKKKADGDDFDLASLRKKCLATIIQMLSSGISALWTMGIVEEGFLQAAWGHALGLLEARPAGITGDPAARTLCADIVAKAVRFFGNSATSASYVALSTALLDMLLRSEHMAASVAEICRLEAVESHHGHVLSTELFTEISKMNMNLVASTGVKNLGLFIEAFAKASPEVMAQLFPIVVRLIDSPAHHIRSAMVQAMGSIVIFVHAEIQSTSASSPVTTGEDAEGRGREKNLTHLTRLRDSLLNMIVERTHDVNPYTRSNVLKIWSALLESNALPVRRVGNISEVAVDRLQDRNYLVRRQAIVLLSAIIEVNPFSGQLDRKVFEIQKEELGKLIDARRAELRAKAEEEAATAPKTSKPFADSINGDGPLDDEESEEEEDGDDDDEEEGGPAYLRDDPDLLMLQAKLDYVISALEFVASLETALPRISALLSSKIASDVVESAHFLTKAVSFRVQDALEHFAISFSLIWHQDATIRTELLACFSQVYLSYDTGNGGSSTVHFLPSKEVAFNLTQLIKTCSSPNILISLERIISEVFVAAPAQALDTILALLALVHQSLSAGSQRRRSGAAAPAGRPGEQEDCSDAAASLHALSMLISDAVGVRADVVASIVRLGFHAQLFADQDYYAVKMACVCVQRCFRSSRSDTKLAQPAKVAGGKKAAALAQAHALAVAHGAPAAADDATVLLQQCMPPLLRLLLDENLRQDAANNHDTNPSWFCAAEEAVHTIFLVHPRPDAVMCSVLQHLYGQIAAQPAAYATVLAGFVFLLGQVAVNVVVYTEAISDLVKSHNKAVLEATKGATREHAKAAAPVEDFEEQMGIAAAMDADHDREVAHLLEQEIVLANLLGGFTDVLRFVVANDSKQFGNPSLRSAAVLAVCRYMTVSSLACEDLLQLAFTVLEHEPSVSLRTSIMVALGDLAFRFPNSLEPWTDRFYARLRDSDDIIRYNSLIILTHLVLNDMIKVKNQVFQVALSLLDPCDNIRDLARLFFIKLAERSHNPVYNLLGDIISRLSQDASMGVGAEGFRDVMHFLLSFVRKDKQADQLLERLLARLAAAEERRTRQCIAFCVSELSVSDKGLKRLIESVKLIKSALMDQEVFACFEKMLARARKGFAGASSSGAQDDEVPPPAAAASASSASAEGAAKAAGAPSSGASKTLLAEAEKALHAAVSGAEEGAEGDETVAGAPDAEGEDPEAARPKKAAAKKPVAPKKVTAKKAATKKTPKPAKRRGGGDSDEDQSDVASSSSEGEAAEEAEEVRRPVRPAGATKRAPRIIDDEDD